MALAVTLMTQIALSLVSQAMAVLAPSVTRAAGVSSEQIGSLAAVTSFGTVWFLMGGLRLLRDMGAVRLLQAGVLLSAAGLLLSLAGYWPLTLLAGLLIGLGYGPAPPAGNQILMDTAPPRHRALIFSVKQSGAPLGAALAGLLLPLLAERIGWRMALVATASVVAATAVIVEPFRAVVDKKRGRVDASSLTALVSPAMVLAPFLALRGPTGLKQMAFAGFAFSTVQGSVFALYVTFLVVGLGFDLTTAGLAFAVLQLAGAVARVVMGLIADRVAQPLALLGVLGLGSSVMMVLVAMMDRGWSWTLILAVSAATGVFAASWNGVLMSEIAKASPPGRVGELSSAATFFIFIGYVMGPGLFAALIRSTGSFTLGFTALELIPLCGAGILFHRLWRERAPG